MDGDSSKGLTDGIAKMRAGKGKGLMSTRLDNRVNITISARRDIPENELRKKRKKKPPIVYSEPEIHLDITIPRPSNVMHDRVVSDEDETDMWYEEPLQGDPHQVGTGSSHASMSVGPTRVRIVSRFAPSQSVTQRADNNDGWLVKYGLEDGRPRIHHVIPSFRGHIAYRLWRDGPDACKMADISFYACPSMLKELMDTPAFIERWQPDTNTFHMPFEEMTVTLHDVWYILRVPICETPLLPDPDVCSADIVAAFLGYKTDVELKGPIGLKEGSKVLWMKSGAVHVRGLIARAASMADVDAAKMWLFCLLGSSLFMDKTSDRVRVQLVEFIRMTDQITKYAWGTATLAWLYLQLGKATRADIVGRAGCMHLLQSWIHEYFPHTRKSVVHPEPRREGEPLCGRWASTDAIASGPDGRDKRLAYYRRLLDSLES
ncbi:Protein MAIN-LIKE 1 [Linum grandiflorum]